MIRKGFTLIELVIIISIVAILMAVAIPKFSNMTSDAKQKSTNSVAHALNIASQTNYSLSRTGSSSSVSVTNCTDVANALPANQPLPSGYVITSLAIVAGGSATCTVTHPDGSTTATFIGMGV